MKCFFLFSFVFFPPSHDARYSSNCCGVSESKEQRKGAVHKWESSYKPHQHVSWCPDATVKEYLSPSARRGMHACHRNPSSTTNGQPKNSNISCPTNNLQAAKAKRKERKKGYGSNAKRNSEKMQRKKRFSLMRCFPNPNPNPNLVVVVEMRFCRGNPHASSFWFWPPYLFCFATAESDSVLRTTTHDLVVTPSSALYACGVTPSVAGGPSSSSGNRGRVWDL